jgi:hypothetical protein
MAVSDTARLTLCFDANPCHCCSYAATGVVTLIVCHRRGFRGDSPGTWLLHSTPAMGADGITALAKERPVPHCPQIWGDAGGEPMSITMLDWIGAQGFTESDRAVLLEEDAGEAAVTHGGAALLGLAWKQRYSKREPSVQHVEGSLSAPESGALGPPLQRARESHKDFALPCRDNIPTVCLTDRPTISDESPID